MIAIYKWEYNEFIKTKKLTSENWSFVYFLANGSVICDVTFLVCQMHASVDVDFISIRSAGVK